MLYLCIYERDENARDQNDRTLLISSSAPEILQVVADAFARKLGNRTPAVVRQLQTPPAQRALKAVPSPAPEKPEDQEPAAS
jgi:hypothetical protein